MRRVYTVYILRNVARPLAVELAIVLALIGASAFFVSLQDIFNNLYSLHSIQTVSRYLVAAFINTQAIVKALSISVIIVAALFGYDAVRRLSRARSITSA